VSLFAIPPKVSRRGRSKALVPYGLVCPHGHGPLVRFSETQPALFVHGGYGAAQQTIWHACLASRCGYSVTSEVSEINPRPFWA
jgi:hypothetical protein